MNGFFSLPIEVLLKIYEKLSPQELSRMLLSGDKHIQIRRDALVVALFMNESDEAKPYQKKIIQSWYEGRFTYPLVFKQSYHNVYH
jgi:hypothetical protein